MIFHDSTKFPGEKYWELGDLKIFELAILDTYLKKKIASSPWKSVKIYRVEWMGLNFDDYSYNYPSPKQTLPKHMQHSVCTYSKYIAIKYMTIQYCDLS